MALNINKIEIVDGVIHLEGGMKSLINLCKYDLKVSHRFFREFVLAGDLVDDKGAALFTKGSTITVAEIKTILKLSEEYDKNFEIKPIIEPNSALMAHFRKEIMSLIIRLIDFRTKYKVYTKFFNPIINEMKEFMIDLLKDDSLVLHLYKMQYNAKNASLAEAKAYFNHLCSVALFSYAVVQIPELKEKVNFTQENVKDLVKAAFFFSMGALSEIDKIIGLPLDNRKEGFDDENKESANMLQYMELNDDVIDAIIFANEYAEGVYEIIQMNEPNAWMANIIIVMNCYLQEESGLFGVKTKLTDIIDHLNLYAVEKKIKTEVVMPFTLGLNMEDIFDFYQEIEDLRGLCDRNCSIPYPMTTKSRPTLFVCRDSIASCTHYEGGTKAVSLMQNIMELDAGRYCRCAIASNRLGEFYKTHENLIKKD